MNIFSIFLQMLPLVVFIIVDSIVNNTVFSIIIAIIFAIVQMIVTYVLLKHIDYFILLDTGLIVLMGVISIVFNNEIFFKVKPAIIEGLFFIFILVMMFLPETFMLNYFSRNAGGMSINSVMLPHLKKMLIFMDAYILLHIAAIIYTAFRSSKKVWGFVSGPGLYFLFVPVVVYIIIKRVRMSKRKIIVNRTEK